MAFWLLALARQAQRDEIRLPRRLIYVVNRRTVVDQATRDAEKMRKALGTPDLAPEAHALRGLGASASENPLAISTLRGQFADNAEWRIDPGRPAIVVGTVDMIGSRLLFSGYGCGFKSRPLHAGFLGQDSLLIHDEAHLEPAFQALIGAIQEEQDRCHDVRPLRVMALTATSRDNRSAAGLTDAAKNPGSVGDASEPLREVWKRTSAKKGAAFHPVNDEAAIPDKVLELAKAHEDTGQAILVFLRKVDDVEKLADRLPKGRTQSLTGTMRGYERDRLVNMDSVFARFLREPPPGVTPETGAVYLVCTSAGEVGVNISADHLVCDLTPFDSMAQRLGRVNRFGNGDAKIDVVHAVRNASDEAARLTANAQDAPIPTNGTDRADETEGEIGRSANVGEGDNETETADDGDSAFESCVHPYLAPAGASAGTGRWSSRCQSHRT